CNLTGWWESKLSSRMHVSTVDSQGDFSSGYRTAVSSAQKPIEPCPLVSSQHLDEDGQCTFGFAVSWKKFSQPATGKPPDATTAFAGQCFVDVAGKETLTTMWLLREAVGSLEEDWKATR
ncbi:Avidin, partial [Pygoscelis adeliae]